jgi:DNA-binding beta-propeller fold protein YncE
VKKKIFFTALAFVIFFSFCAAEEQKKSDDEVTTIYDQPTTLVYPSFWHTPFGIHKGTPFYLKMFLGGRTYFDDPQDLACTKLLIDYGKINKDKDDWQLTVYGVNSGRGEIIYNSSMHSLAVFGSRGSNDGELLNPVGIACNEYGDVYVADTGNNRIARFFNNGKRVKFIRNIGGTGQEPGKLMKPSYIALDSAGRIYVSDTGNNRIEIFSRSGGYLSVIGQDRGVFNPQGICVCDDAERYSGFKDNFIYLIDGNNDRLQKFDMSGNLAQSIRVNEVLGKNVFLTTLEQDFYGNLYIVDKLNSMVYKFTPDLRFITGFGGFGTKDYQFENPTGIAVYKHYGQIFVSDRESAQYFWLGSDASDFNVSQLKNDAACRLQFDFKLTEKSFITIQVVDAGGNTVEVCRQIGAEMGKNSVDWDVPEKFKAIIKPGGVYSVLLRIMATYSSYPHIEKVVKSAITIQ